MLIDRLEQAKANQRMVALHTNGTTFLGYILSLNPDLLVVRTITRQGLLTGVRSLQLGAISRVDFDDRYVRLIEFKEHNPEIAFGQPAAPEGLDDTYVTTEALLQQAKEVRQLIFVETTLDVDFYGYVKQLSDDELLLEVYNEYAEADGLTVLSLDKVQSIVWSDEVTRTIELLLRQSGSNGLRAN